MSSHQSRKAKTNPSTTRSQCSGARENGFIIWWCTIGLCLLDLVGAACRNCLLLLYHCQYVLYRWHLLRSDMKIHFRISSHSDISRTLLGWRTQGNVQHAGVALDGNVGSNRTVLRLKSALPFRLQILIDRRTRSKERIRRGSKQELRIVI